MATYFYDKNGATAGFGTLTGNWSDATWSTSGAGTATPGAVTFTTADIASFGGTSNTATAGTISTSGTIQIGGFITQNLSTGPQYISGTGTFAAGSTTISMQIGTELIINPTTTITGTGGLTFNGTLYPRIYSNMTGLSGTITQSTGATYFVIGAYQDNAQIFNPATINTVVANGNAGTPFLFYQNPSALVNAFTVNANLTGTRRVQQQNDVATTFTVTINGSMATLPEYGIWLNGTTVARDLPSSAIVFQSAATGFSTFTLNLPTGAAQTSFATGLRNECTSSGAGTYTNTFNSSGVLPVTLAGGITRTAGDLAADKVVVFQLGGSNTGANTINGASAVTAPAVMSLVKVDAGTWVLTGNNTAFSSVTINNGQLRLSSATATVSGTVTVGTLGTLSLENRGTFANNINATGKVSSYAGTNTLTGTISLTGSATFEAVAGTLFVNSGASVSGTQNVSFDGTGLGTIDFQSVLANGTGTVTKNGSSTVILRANNTFTGALTLAGGWAEVSTLNQSGVAGPLGQGSTIIFTGTGLLRYTGSSSVTFNRSLTFTSATGAGIENNGSGTLTLTGAVSATSSTIALAGSNTGFNRFETAIVSGANGFAKSGAGRWIVVGANDITGSSPITGGTLVAANAATNKKLVGSPVISGGAKLQIAKESDNKGRCTYGSLSMGLGATAGNKARLRIGGIATSPTVRMSGNLVLPTSGTTTFDVSGDAFKTPGTYTLIEFASGGVTGGTIAANATAYTGSPYRSAVLSQTGGASGPITVTISAVP